MPYVRTVKTASGATAVQIVWSSQRGSREIEHLGSAHDEAGLELLKAAARQRLVAGQGVLDLGLEATEPARRGRGGGPLPITSARRAACSMPCRMPMASWASTGRLAAMRCSPSWCWPGSSSR